MKKLVALLLALVLTFSCSAALAELTFTTGGTSGTYYAFGGVLAQYITDHSDVAVTAVAGEGSAANIDMLDMGFAQLGFVQSDVAYYAYNGIRFEQYEGNPITSFTALAALYNETVQLVTCDPSIQSMEDLKGKKTANTISSTYATQAESYGAEVTGVDDLNQTIELLLSDRIDATLNAEVTYYDYLAAHPEADIKIATLSDDAEQIAIPVRKGADTATLLKAVNDALSDLSASGELTALSEKYFGMDISKMD